jgi:hypothetical protein
MPRTFYKCPRCGSQLLMLRRMVWQAFDGTTHQLGPVDDADWDDSLDAYCRVCDSDADHVFALREGGIEATPHYGGYVEYFSEEDKALANAVELLREAADACDAADPQARDAILSLAHDLAASVVTK